MPIIRIIAPSSFSTPDNVDACLLQVIAQLSELTGINQEFISATFQTLPAGHYQAGGEANTKLPLLVECLIPSFHNGQKQTVILDALAQALLDTFKLRQDQLFIELRLAQSGRIWDSGEILRWDK